MKAEIINGTLVLFPESPTERYALKHWRQDSQVITQDFSRMETRYIRYSAIEIEPPECAT